MELSRDIEQMIPVVRAAAKKLKAEAELEKETVSKKQKSSSSKDPPQVMDISND